MPTSLAMEKRVGGTPPVPARCVTLAGGHFQSSWILCQVELKSNLSVWVQLPVGQALGAGPFYR